MYFLVHRTVGWFRLAGAWGAPLLSRRAGQTGLLTALPSQPMKPPRMEMAQHPRIWLHRWAVLLGKRLLISSLNLLCLDQPQSSSLLNNLVLKLKERHYSPICVADFHISL